MKELRVIALLLIFFFLFLSYLSNPASSHDWYPLECCHDFHCDVAKKIEFIKENDKEGWLVTTKHGTAFFPKDFSIRDSKDGNIHACMISGENDTKRPLCLFFPGTS